MALHDHAAHIQQTIMSDVLEMDHIARPKEDTIAAMESIDQCRMVKRQPPVIAALFQHRPLYTGTGFLVRHTVQLGQAPARGN